MNMQINTFGKGAMRVNSKQPFLVQKLAEQWSENNEAPSMPDDKSWRGSMAGSCARQVAYRLSDTEASDPIDLAGFWNMGLGSMIHNELEQAIHDWADSQPNVEVIAEHEMELGERGYGHADTLVIMDIPWVGKVKVLFELKTVGGFGYKNMIGLNKNKYAEGPKWSAFVQGAMYASAVDADLLVIGYLAREGVSKNMAKNYSKSEIERMGAEWHYTKEQYMVVAAEEIERLDGIAAAGAEGRTPAEIPARFSKSDPEIPFPAEVTHPEKGAWRLYAKDGSLVNAGTTWMCNYCQFQQQCKGDTDDVLSRDA